MKCARRLVKLFIDNFNIHFLHFIYLFPTCQSSMIGS